MCELLKTRRSTRKYRPEQVPDELLDAVLEAGLYAPSAMNNQKPVMVAVRDKATRDQLSAMNAAVMGTERDPFYGAPCVIVVLADPTYPTWVEDGSLVLGNLLNAAHAVELGSSGSTAPGRCSTPRRARRFCASGASRNTTGASAAAFWVTPTRLPPPRSGQPTAFGKSDKGEK